MVKYLVGPGTDFENWITSVLPKQLNVSASKERLMKIKFDKFADYVRPLEKVAPKEFDFFYSAIKKRFKEVSKERAPKGKRAIRGFGILKK